MIFWVLFCTSSCHIGQHIYLLIYIYIYMHIYIYIYICIHIWVLHKHNSKVPSAACFRGVVFLYTKPLEPEESGPRDTPEECV